MTTQVEHLQVDASTDEQMREIRAEVGRFVPDQRFMSDCD